MEKLKNFNNIPEPSYDFDVSDHGSHEYRSQGADLSRLIDEINPRITNHEDFSGFGVSEKVKKLNIEHRLLAPYSDAGETNPAESGISSLAKLSDESWLFTYAGYMGKLNPSGEIEKLADIETKAPDWNLFGNAHIGQKIGDTDVSFESVTIFNAEAKVGKNGGDDDEFDKFRRNVKKRILDYSKNNKISPL